MEHTLDMQSVAAHWGELPPSRAAHPADALLSWRSRAAVSMPRSPTSTTLVIANRSLTLVTWLATVVGSPVFPAKTSIATGMPPGEVSSP